MHRERKTENISEGAVNGKTPKNKIKESGFCLRLTFQKEKKKKLNFKLASKVIL